MKTQTKIDAALAAISLLVVAAVADINKTWHLAAFVAACSLLLVLMTVSTIVCAWFGHLLIKLLTFGRVDLAWKQGSESILTQWIGLFSVLAIGGIIAWVVQR
jgi:hypothetical protein